MLSYSTTSYIFVSLFVIVVYFIYLGTFSDSHSLLYECTVLYRCTALVICTVLYKCTGGGDFAAHRGQGTTQTQKRAKLEDVITRSFSYISKIYYNPGA